jgi:hypothetical protein
MKHLITSDKTFRAWCKRPGCGVSLEGYAVESMTQKDLDDFFKGGICPSVFSSKVKLKTEKQAITYLLKYAKKQIKDWQRLINYWDKRD